MRAWCLIASAGIRDAPSIGADLVRCAALLSARDSAGCTHACFSVVRADLALGTAIKSAGPTLGIGTAPVILGALLAGCAAGNDGDTADGDGKVSTALF